MTVRQIGERGNRMRSWDCRADVEPLWILKRKAYETRMETSRPKDWWRSKTDQRQEG